MRLTATDFYTYYRPSECELRVYLKHQGEPEAAPSPFDEVIRRLGERHERDHLASLAGVVRLDAGTRAERERLTLQAVADGVAAVYQPALRASAVFDGATWEVVGDPDFLIRSDDGYAVRDCKLARRITADDHLEIILQAELYGWLYEQTFDRVPARLEILSGTGDLVEVPYGGGSAALEGLRRVAALKLAADEPYSPVGWTKCGGCPFQPRCWPRAVARKDVALVFGVDQSLAIALRASGVATYPALVEQFDLERLAEFRRLRGGDKPQRVGDAAESILRMARSLATGREIPIRPPVIPEHPSYVMFDIEGLPAHLDEEEKIYLWGLMVCGERPQPFQAACADFGPEGDRAGWLEFLRLSGAIFAAYGDVPFVHWATYERSHLDLYVRRYGDPDGVGARVRTRLLDLLPLTRSAVALPLPSYSLKVVEKHVGFRRALGEVAGDWAMAKYIEATETADERVRAGVMDQILEYNREDLEATWAVLQWLKAKATRTAR